MKNLPFSLIRGNVAVACVCGKHFSLLPKSVNYKKQKLYNIGPLEKPIFSNDKTSVETKGCSKTEDNFEWNSSMFCSSMCFVVQTSVVECFLIRKLVIRMCCNTS